MPIEHLQSGEHAIIDRIDGSDDFLRRILSMGLTPGARVTVVQNRKANPLLVYVRDSYVALGRKELHSISVRRA